MKKMLIGVLVILLILAGLLPWYEGYWFKQNYLTIIANINQENQFQITVQKYQLGWLHSHVVLQITPVSHKTNIPAPNNLLKDELANYGTITLDQIISHGPIVCDKTGAESQYTLATASIYNLIYLSPKLENYLFGNNYKPAAQINTLVNFNGDWVNQLLTPAFSVSIKNTGKVTWQGMKGIAYFKVVNDKVVMTQSNLKIGAITAESNTTQQIPNLQIAVQPILLSGQAMRQPIGLWDEEADASLPEILIKDVAGLKFKMQNLSIKNSGAVNANMYNAAFNISLQKLAIPEFFIPEFSQANLNVSVNNLNANAIVALVNFVRSTQAQQIPPEEFFRQYNAKLISLITPTTTITVENSVNTKLGAFALNTIVSWPVNTPLPTSLDDIDQNVNVKIDIKMAVPLARKLADMSSSYSIPETESTQGPPAPSKPTIPLQPVPAATNTPANLMDVWLQQGYIVQQNNDYVTSIACMGKACLINGKPILQNVSVPER